MYKKLQPFLQKELDSIREAGLFKKERIITTPQGADIKTTEGKEFYKTVNDIQTFTEQLCTLSDKIFSSHRGELLIKLLKMVM